MTTSTQKSALVTAAKEVLKNPYAVKNRLTYSAAVLTDQGNIYAATSYFSDTYSLTLHGEQAALAHASFHGEGDIVAMACAGLEDKKPGSFTNPCHMCKQLMYESSRRSGLPMLVILTNQHEETQEVKLEDMVSYPWPE